MAPSYSRHVADTKPPATPSEAYFEAAFEVAKGSVDRARAGAEFVEKAAAAIVTIYTGALAVAFSVADNPLPLRGLIPATFLGLAVALAAFYLAYPSVDVKWSTVPTGAKKSDPVAWFTAFQAWMRGIVLRRSNLLRASLMALLFGVLFLPTPFVKVKTKPATPPQRVGWPAPPSNNIQVQKILYQARVSEVAKLREKAAPQPKGEFSIDEHWLWWASALALAVVGITAIRRTQPPAVTHQANQIPIGPFGYR